MAASPFQLSLNPFGRLVFTAADGSEYVGAIPVRAFPVSAPDEGISLVSPDGHELLWIEQLKELSPAHAQLIRQELEGREFMPEIQALHQVSTFATPSTWRVDTDRGPAEFILKGEEDIRRLPGNVLLIADSHGVQYMIRDLQKMDKHSRKLLDRFL